VILEGDLVEKVLTSEISKQTFSGMYNIMYIGFLVVSTLILSLVFLLVQ